MPARRSGEGAAGFAKVGFYGDPPFFVTEGCDVLRHRLAPGPADDAEPAPAGVAGNRLSPLWPLAGLAAGQVGAGLPPAAYAHYRDRLDLSDQQVTALFAFLILGVMLVLWLCWLGLAAVRRGPALAAALAAAAVADLLLLSAASYPSLAAASGLLGCSLGAVCALVPGVLNTLVPQGDRASSWVTTANAAGLAAGPVVAGTMNQFLPLPYQLVYALHALLCLGIAVPLRHAPAGAATGARRRGTNLPARPGYRAALLRGYLAFAVGGLVTSLVAVLLKDEFGLGSSAAAGGLIAAFFAANAVVGGFVVARRAANARLIGSTLLVLGLVLATVAVSTQSPAVLAAAIVLAGGGQGVLIGTGILVASRADSASGHNTAVPVFFLWCYAGAVTAAVSVGWVSGASSSGMAFLLELAAVVLGLLAVDLREAKRRGRHG